MSNASSSTSSTERLPAGRVGRPHGLAGAFHVTKPRTRLLDAAAAVTVAGVDRRVIHRGGTLENPVLRIPGVESREAAELLRGTDLMVERSAAPPLGEDEWLAEDLVGCRVLDGERPIGEVRALLPYPSCDLLDVRGGDAGALLVPLIGDAVRSVDVEAKRIDIDSAFIGLEDDGAA